MTNETAINVANITNSGRFPFLSESGEELPQRKPLLLHSCCGPCSTAVMERLAPCYDLTLFFFNPNITDEDEYRRRLDAQRLAVERFNASPAAVFPVGLEVGEYEPAVFLEAVKGLESEPEGGERCTVCFLLRLERAAAYAALSGIERFSTTLSISPHKNYPLINELGIKTALRFGLTFLSEDFKKKDGFARSLRLSNLYGLYRQNYCGCEFSRGASRS